MKEIVFCVASQDTVTYTTSQKEAGFGLMATDDIKPLELGGSRPLLNGSLQGSKKSINYFMRRKYYGTYNN